MASTYPLSDYLSPSEARIRADLLDVLNRPDAPRQRFTFNPVETLLCCGLAFVINHRKYSSRNRDQAPSPIPELARFTKRSNGSILSKIVNLEGGLSHGGAHDMTVAGHWWNDVPGYANVYTAIISAARSLGIGPDEVPDFLRLVDPTAEPPVIASSQSAPSLAPRTLTDSEEPTTEEVTEVTKKVPDWTPSQSEAFVVARTRVGQQRFAQQVLTNFHHSCALCGLSPQVIEPPVNYRLLVASHIKPWREADTTERLDPSNGIAACPLHDAAFDQGLITLDESLHITTSARLASAIERDPQFARFFTPPGMADHLLLPDGTAAPSAKYVNWHREHVFVAA